ncbi:MAG TPA: hypothetical protein VGK06_10760 [Methanosarcina sp.]
MTNVEEIEAICHGSSLNPKTHGAFYKIVENLHNKIIGSVAKISE